jgi:hypothetical protein
MLLPDKHIKFSESLLGLGSFLLSILKKPMSVDTLWREYSQARDSATYPAYHSFENIVLALDFLFAIGAISYGENGLIEKCS